MTLDVLKAIREDKTWGWEEQIANVEGHYCGKKLHLDEGFQCSIHRHPKGETFYIESGGVYFELGTHPLTLDGGLLLPTDIIHIPSYYWHRFSGIDDSVIIEFSDSDCSSERYTNSGAIVDFDTWRKRVLAHHGI